MFSIDRPKHMVSGYTPCHCGGDCPMGRLSNGCPMSTASFWQTFEPIDPRPGAPNRMSLGDLFFRLPDAMRPEDV